MSNHSSTLSRRELAQAEEIERLLKLQLDRPERDSVMLEYVLSFALEMFDLYNEVYSRDALDLAGAAAEAKIRATFRIITCMDQKHFFSNPSKKILCIEEIEEAIDQKISRIIPPKMGLRTLPTSPLGLMAIPSVKLPAKSRLGSVPNQLHALKTESRMTFEEIHEGIHLDVRSIKRHFSGETKPRNKQLRAYEQFFSDLLSRPVRITTGLMSL